MTKTEIQEKIEELKKEIDETNNEISDLESEIEDMERELEWKRSDVEDMESQLEYYQKQLLKLQNPEEQLPYWIDFIHDDCRSDLDGQFERNGKWYICNGFVLLELATKIDGLNECKGKDTLPALFEREKEPLEFDIEKLSDDEILGTDVKILPRLLVQGTYLAVVRHILQLNNQSNFYYYAGASSQNSKTLSLICENENGRALILGKTFWEDLQ